MARSRLERVQRKRAGKQGLTYLIIAIVIGVVMLFWGLPALAGLAGLLIKSDDSTVNHELRPTPPIFADVPVATYSATVSVTGFAQPGVDVIMYLGGVEIDRKLTSDSGTFDFDNLPLSEGDNEIYAYASSKHELLSEKSKSYTITLDSTKPNVTLDSPRDGEVFRGQSQRIATFGGKVDEEGSKVYIGERMVIVQADGTFSLPYQLVEGDQELTIKAVDKAGNENASTIKLRWEP